MTGLKFGRLTVLSDSGKRAGKHVKWNCVCDCGNNCIIDGTKLRNGHTQSCGCLWMQSISTLNGFSKTREYTVFKTRREQLRKKNQTPIWASQEKILEVYKNCPKGYHVDHIVPISGKNVCGLHVHYNLQYLTKEDNLRKSNKHHVQEA